MTSCTIGIDVGTGSMHAGVFNLAGHLIGKGVHDIQSWRSAVDFVEQSSDDIWQACCQSV